MHHRSITSSVAFVLALGTVATAQAEERPSGIGIGVQTLLSSDFGQGPAGPAITFQTAAFHVEGILAFSDVGDETDLALAGRFWYAVSQTSRSDFSVGGGIGLLINDEGPDDSDIDIELDGGAQLRAFVVPNVAISVTLGLSLVAQDGPDPLRFSGNILGSGGISYFF